MDFVTPQPFSGDRMDHVLSLLLFVANNELLTHYIYSRLQDSPYSEKIPDLLGLSQTASAEDWQHYRAIVECIEHLRGDQFMPPLQSVALSRYRKQKRYGIEKLLRVLRVTEEASIHAYSEICSLTLERDYRTFDLCYQNLYENIYHQHSVIGLLKRQLPTDKVGQSQPSLKDYPRLKPALFSSVLTV